MRAPAMSCHPRYYNESSEGYRVRYGRRIFVEKKSAANAVMWDIAVARMSLDKNDLFASPYIYRMLDSKRWVIGEGWNVKMDKGEWYPTLAAAIATLALQGKWEPW